MRVEILDNNKVVFVKMTDEEAIKTIESLATQLKTGNPNTNRLETNDEKGILFSIAIM